MFDGDCQAAGDGVFVAVAGREQSRTLRHWARQAGMGLQRRASAAVGPLLGVARALAKRAVHAHRRRIALRELAALDDRMLKDIGLSRGLLPYEVERMLSELEEREAASASVGQEPFRRAA